MLKNENIICISSIDWDFIWQGHQEIMSAFARNGNRVLFIENTGVRSPHLKDIKRLKKRIVNWFASVKGFKKEAENLFIYSPVVLPFPYSKFASWINKRLLIEPLKRWMKAMSFHAPVVWTFLPTSIALDIIHECDDRKLLVYYDIADFDALTDNPKRLKESEEALVKICDVVFAQGKAIADKCGKLNPNVHIFPFGVNAQVFEDFAKTSPRFKPDDLRDIKRPIVGYVGGIHKHVDIALIRHIAKTHPDWSVVLVGPKQTDTRELEGAPNIFALGKKEFEKLPAYIDQFDVCTIPYVISEYTKTVYPTKLNEYHIMGKPVVSTALPEVEALNAGNGNMTAIAKTHAEFVTLVEKALVEDHEQAAQARKDIAKKSRWSERIQEMSALMEKSIDRKKNELPVSWQEKFLLAYKNSRHAITRVVAGAIVAYLLVFYTPLVWVLAAPLVVSGDLRKADAIVVLGGGVGESGKVGQGYEERVQYAVELYKKGYADRVVFSSGYVHVFKETLVMKALAVSLGVPENAIIMENRPANTYENVEAIKDLSGREHWKSIVLLSSPYPMLRVSKTFAKVAPDIAVVYAPVPNGIFYCHGNENLFGKKISAQQIQGIAHEYAGIVYYWLRGWI